MSAAETIQRFASSEYGQNIFVDPPQFDSESKTYYSNIRSKLPVFIHDERYPGKYKVRVLKLDSIGKIYLNQKLELIPNLTTRRNKCYENLENLIKIWRYRIENIVITSSSTEFAKIKEFRNHFGKIRQIIDHLTEFGEIKNDEIKLYNPKEDQLKLTQYLSLLEGIDLVRKGETNYLMGNKMVGLTKRIKDPEELETTILSYIIKNRYLTLKNAFNLNRLESTIAIDNVIYYPEIELEESVYRKRGLIERSYKYHYNKKINPLRLTRILTNLERCGAIKREDDIFFGQDHLREEMVTMKLNEPPLVSSRV